MKGTKYAELASLSEEQINKQIADARSRLTALAFQKTVGHLENHAQFETIRRDIARMNTALRAKKPTV
jgi:large subunit ribosomal protein L29